MEPKLPTDAEILAVEGDPDATLALLTRVAEEIRACAGDDASTAPAKVLRRNRYDWGLAAEMLGRGMRVDDVAQMIGCNRTSLWRAIRRSPGLRRMIDRRHEESEGTARTALRGQRDRIADALLDCAVNDRNAQVLFRLAKEMGLMSFSGVLHPNAHGVTRSWPPQPPKR